MESKTIKFLNDNSWKEEIFEFAESILKNKQILNGTSSDALETMKLVFSIYYDDHIFRDKFDILNPNSNENL